MQVKSPELMTIHHTVERAPRDAQQARGGAQVAAGAIERVLERARLGVVDGARSDAIELAATDPDVIRAIEGGTLGRVAMTYVEWAGADYAFTIADWSIVEDEASAQRFASVVARAPLQTALWTSISNVIDFGLAALATNDIEGTRRVIDISGDGPNNQGGLVTKHRDRAIAAGGSGHQDIERCALGE